MKSNKWGYGFLTGVLAFSILSGCTNEEASKEKSESAVKINKTGMPIADEKIELTGFAGKFFASQDWNKLKLWEEYAKISNVEIDWETVQVDSLKEKRNLLLASGEYPDVLFSSALPKADLIKYGQQGVLLKLNDLIDQYAPNFKKLMEENPVVAKGVTMPDGSIYGFPTIYDPEFKGLHLGTPWINKNWLKKLGLEEPQNLDDFYKVLKAFKEEDPNGNGKADEIPWTGAYGIGEAIGFIKGSFGLNNHGSANAYIDLAPGSNNLRFTPASDEYKEMLEYLHKLYKDGLIDKEIFTADPQAFTAKASDGTFGVINGLDPETIYQLKGYVGIPVLKGPKGEQMLTSMGSPLGNIGMFVITDKNKNPEATIRWIDHFYGDEGTKMFFMGFEGVTYEEKNGELEYTENMTKNPDGLNLDQALSEYLTWPGGYYPGIVKEKYFKGAEGKPATKENALKSEPYAIKQEDIWPAFNFSPEEQEELSTISTDITTYVDEMTASFISGKTPLSKWEDYVQTLKQMNLDRYMEIYESGYKNYKK